MFTQFASPLPELTCQQVTQKTDGILLLMANAATTAHCPLCGLSSQRIHSHYSRRLADLPVQGQPCRWQIQACKFFCDNPHCARRIFTQRFTQQIQPYARWLDRCQGQLRQVGLAAGGQLGCRMGQLVGLIVSASTLLRRVRQQPLPAMDTPRVLGIDDWAFKKGQRYGTILVDLEKHQVVDLLPDREMETVRTWLQGHPGVQIISRDRASSYAQAATQGAPQAIQVADRWHLLKNLGDALQRLLETQRPAIKQAALSCAGAIPLPPAKPVDAASEPALPTQPIAISERQRVYQQVKAYQAIGKSISWVATQLRLSRHTVRKYWHWVTYQPKTARRWSSISVYEDHLRQRWKEGYCTAQALFDDLREKGFGGSLRTVYRWVAAQAGQVTAATKVAPPLEYSPRQVSFWLTRLADELPSQGVKDFMNALCLASPILKRVWSIALRFKSLMKARRVEELNDWLVECEGLELDVLSQFVSGLRGDYGAVRQAFCSEWSNGQVEGQVNRLKTLKRGMYGRAGLGLLRHRLVVSRP